MLSYLSSGFLSAQDCETPDISQVEYEAIPWYGDENSYTELDRLYDSLVNIYGSTGTNTRSVEEGLLLRVPIKFWMYRNGPGIDGGG